MKLFKQIVIFGLTIVSISCSEHADDIFKINEQGEITLNEGEFIPHDSVQNLEHDDKFNTKKYYPEEPKEKMQFMIIKRTQDVPPTKKYVVAHSSAEMTNYHNKQPSKVAYSVSHKAKPKPKRMPVKVVQEGSVKHIYLDMPDMFDDEPQKPSTVSQTYDHVKQAASNNHYQYKSVHQGNYQPFGQQVQYSHIPASGLSHVRNGFNSVSHIPFSGLSPVGNGFNSVSLGPSSGLSPVGNSFNSVSHGPSSGFSQIGNSFNSVSLGSSSGLSQVGNDFNSVSHGPSSGLTKIGNGFSSVSHAPSFGLGQIDNDFNTVSSGYRIGKSNGVNPIQGYAQHGYPGAYGNQIYSSSSKFGPQTFDNSPYTIQGASQFAPSFQNQFSHPQLPQFSADGKERFTYEIPQQYKSLFANNAFTAPQYGQQQAFTPNAANNFAYPQPQQYEFGTTERLGQVSGFDPDLVNVVNDVVNKGQGYPTPDGFRMIKSNDEKSVYLIGKPGMPLDTVPNIASYNFPADTKEPTQQQVSSKIRFV